MTDPAAAPRDDIQRPLDESLPSGAEAAGADPADASDATPLRAAVPAAVAPGARAPRWARGTRRWIAPALRALRLAPGRAAQAVAAWSRRPSGRLVLPAVMLTVLVGVAIAAGGFLIPAAADRPDDTAGGPPAAVEPTGITSAAPTGVPRVGGTTAPTSQPSELGDPSGVLHDWAAQMSERTNVPEVALRAYGYAELVVAELTPACQLSWTTLAAIGRVESNHGSGNGATLLDDGRALPAIIGAPLDGRDGRERIEDTDTGALDGDPTYDRAVGPMQFIPRTWQLEHIDADGDGTADPHNIHDAALAAANHLCSGGRDLTTAGDWWAAVLAYNDVQSYAEAVFAAANEYGRQSRAAG